MTAQTFFSPKMVDQTFDTVTTGVHAAVDAGKTMQDGMQKAFTTAMNGAGAMNPGDGNAAFAPAERMGREFFPMVRKNLDVAVETFDATAKANREFMHVALDTMNMNQNESVQDRSRKMFDAAFAMFRTNTDAAMKTNAKVMENFTEFFNMACGTTGCCGMGQTNGNGQAHKNAQPSPAGKQNR